MEVYALYSSMGGKMGLPSMDVGGEEEDPSDVPLLAFSVVCTVVSRLGVG